jgi:hypothetical protein
MHEPQLVPALSWAPISAALPAPAAMASQMVVQPTPNYNGYLIFEGISVDEAGKQHREVAQSAASRPSFPASFFFRNCLTRSFILMGCRPGDVPIDWACSTSIRGDHPNLFQSRSTSTGCTVL